MSAATTLREAVLRGLHPSGNGEREVATVMRALAPMGGTKEQSDACIALGRLAAWAEAGLTPLYVIEDRGRV